MPWRQRLAAAVRPARAQRRECRRCRPVRGARGASRSDSRLGDTREEAKAFRAGLEGNISQGTPNELEATTVEHGVDPAMLTPGLCAVRIAEPAVTGTEVGKGSA